MSFGACKFIKNLRSSTGEILRTICATEVVQTYYENAALCASLNMDLAKVDNIQVEKAILAYTNQIYSSVLPGIVFVDGVKQYGYCNALSNYYTWNETDYQRAEFPCYSSNFAFCQYKTRKIKKIVLKCWIITIFSIT